MKLSSSKEDVAPKAPGGDPVTPSEHSLKIEHSLPVATEGEGAPRTSGGPLGSGSSEQDAIDLKKAIDLEYDAWKDIVRRQKMAYQTDNKDVPISPNDDLLIIQMPRQHRARDYGSSSSSGQGSLDGTSSSR